MTRRGRPTPRPPRLAAGLLDALGGPDRGAIRGDLDEEFAHHVVPERGAAAARRWYWRQTLASLPRLLLRGRTRGVGSDAVDRFRPDRDFRYAVRALLRRPGASVAAAVTFALALAANASVFTLVYTILLHPLPYAHPDRLVRIHPDELFYTQLSGAQRFAERARAFDRVVPWARTLFTFTGGDVAEEARGARVQWDHFDMLGVRPALGRGFRREDAERSPTDALILSQDLWVRRYGADPSVVGRRVEVGGRPHTIVGVMGPEHVPMEPDWQAWAPLPLDASAMEGVGMAMNARLRPGVTLEEAQQDTRRTLATIWTENGDTATPEELAAIRVVPLREYLLGDVRRPVWVLMGSVVVILLLASTNVANLLLAQGERRAPEIAVRLSLGATRARVAIQLVMEALLTAAAGGAAGLGLAIGFVTWISTRLPAGLPRGSSVHVGPVVVLFTLGTMLAAGLLAAVLPAVQSTRSGLRGALSGGGRGRRGRTASILVAVQVALSVVLVAGAGLMVRSLGALAAVDPGFDAVGVVAVRVTPPTGAYDEEGAVARLFTRILAEARALPGVESVGAIMFLPMTSGGAWTRYRSEPEPPDEGQRSASFRIVTPGYFLTLRVPIRSGRAFTHADDADGPPVAIINETMARDFFPGVDPVGRPLYAGDDASHPRRVVGVVADVRQTDLREASFPEVYLPLAQNAFPRMYVVARGSGAPERALSALQAAVRRVDDRLILSRPSTVSAVIDATVADTRLVTQLLALFGTVALALGAVGVYGVTAHAVSRRRREIGVRMALGADASGVAARTVAHGMVPVGVGVVVGLGLAVVAARVLSGLVFGVGTADPATFAMATGILTGVALIALGAPALRASRVEPIRVLRDE